LYEVAVSERKNKFSKQAAKIYSVDEITASLLIFENVEDATIYAPLPRKKDELAFCPTS